MVSSTTDRLAETKASVQQLMTSDSQTNKKNVKALRQQIKSHPKVLAESVPSINRFSDPELEIKSALECKKIEDSFLSETKLQLGPSLLRRTLFANMNNTIANLNDTLVSINQYNFHAHTEAFNTYGTSVSMKNLAHRIRGELGIALAPFYLKFAESLMLESLAQFDRRVGRLAGSSNFKKVLNLLIDLSVTEFEVNLNNLRTGNH